ncbi:MAG TPA: hypothetical protein VIF62_07605 [Labilithrix sp.]
MSFSRTALVLGFLLLNACGASAVGSSGSQLPSLPSGGAGGAGPMGNTPQSGERPQAVVERQAPMGHMGHEARTLSFGCRSCRY